MSNWGPKEASGLLELVRQEGEVRLTGRGLPALSSMHYILWISREGTDDVYRLGEPRLLVDGTTVLDLLLPSAVPNRGWNLALLTVEDSPTPDRPGPRHSLAGRFPQFSPEGLLPRSLPNTGLVGSVSSTGATPSSTDWATGGLAVIVSGGIASRALRAQSGSAGSIRAHPIQADTTVTDGMTEPGDGFPMKTNRRP